jgi:uncharacterized membrane-anchored protein
MLTSIDRLSTGRRVVLIAIVLIAGLVSTLVGVTRIHLNGKPVVLATVPVDPRSLFQGDYVRLNYDINTLEAELFSEADLGQNQEKRGSTVYVELAPEGQVWVAKRASFSPIEPQAGNFLIAGQISSSQSRPMTANRERKIVNVEYPGIKTFFVPEGEGRAIERMERAKDRLTVKVLVAPDGAARPVNLLVDGQPLYDDSGF